jgi:hypothetical protein
MNLDLKKMVGGLILFIGLILFFSSLIDNNLNLALVSLTSALILWVIYGLLLDVFDVRIFAWVVSLSGFLLALSVFFVFGVEEMPHPIGAIVFHAGGIAGSLGIGFFSLFPLLIIHQLNSQNISTKRGVLMNEDGFPSIPNLESDDWELATEEERQSGEFEVG